MSNICEQCGGQKTFYYKVEAIYANDYTPHVLAASNSSMKICTCPIPKPRHNGRLDDRHACHVFYSKVAGKTGIFIENEIDWLEDEIRLNPQQALSLLEWLQQERDKLEQLVKGEENNVP